jgi:hypothetical protein
MNDKYWGYLKTDGAVIVKRWYGNTKEVNNYKLYENVVRVVEPFSANSMGEAVYYAKNKVGVFIKKA